MISQLKKLKPAEVHTLPADDKPVKKLKLRNQLSLEANPEKPRGAIPPADDKPAEDLKNEDKKLVVKNIVDFKTI